MHTQPPVTTASSSTNSPTTNPMAKYASLTEELHSVEPSVVCGGETVTVVYTVEVAILGGVGLKTVVASLGCEHGR